MMDSDGYPTIETLETICKWDANDLDGLMEFILPLWKYADCGYWSQINGTYKIHTAGWSGNEEIITAMRHNQIWWMMFWKSSERGGHYTFEKLTKKTLGLVK